MKLQGQPILLQGIDTSVRELEWKLLLSYHASKLGIGSVIAKGGFLKACQSESKNANWVGRFTSHNGRSKGDSRLMESFKERGTAGFYLHDEAGFSNGVIADRFIINTHPKEHLNNDAFRAVFLWGESQRKTLVDSDFRLASKCIVSGYPRFDFYRPEYAILDNNKVDSIKKRFGKFVLCTTRFGAFNTAIGAQELLSARVFELTKPMFNDETEAQTYLFHRWSKEGMDLLNYVQVVRLLALTFTDLQFVVRHHPKENEDLYHEIFQKLNNVHITHEGDVRPWLRAATAVVQSECTTGMEALLVGTPTINVVKRYQEFDNLSYHLLDRIGQVVSNGEQAIDILEKILNDSDSFGSSDADLALLENDLHNIQEPSIPVILDTILADLRKRPTPDSEVQLPRPQQVPRYSSFKKRIKSYVKSHLMSKSQNLNRDKNRLPFNRISIEELWQTFEDAFGNAGELRSIGDEHIVINGK